MKTPKSIRYKLLRWIIIALTSILFAYSVIVLRRQKENILLRHISSALALSQTAAIPITEAFFFSSANNPVSDDFLQSYINQLWDQNISIIRFIALIDKQGQVRAHSKMDEYGAIYRDEYTTSALGSDTDQFHIYEDPDYGWILETDSNIGISSKKWAVLRIGFQAEELRSELLIAFWGNFTMSLLAVLTVIVATYVITSNLTRKLVQTASIVDKINLQNNELVVFPDSDDEIGRLSDKFTRMQRRLISSRRQLEAASRNLIQTEKLAAVGRLASGVAHEINNPLMGMKNCLYLIEANSDNPVLRQQNIDLLNEGLDRVEMIVKNLLGSVRKPAELPVSFQINESIMSVVELLAYRFSTSRILLSQNLSEDIPVFFGNRVRLEEALLNILLNAMDAVGEVGVIVIESMFRDGQIRISIRDSGQGIPEEIQSSIFEPFFTSKEVGKGTGLGLYVTREILSDMDATIEFLTAAGDDHGTTFTITLPHSNAESTDK